MLREAGKDLYWLPGRNEKVLVCIYTSAGEPFTQSIAYSNDRGRTWAKYSGNPVLGHIVGRNRDPKVIWHDPTGQWVMALYLGGNDYALFSSLCSFASPVLCAIICPKCADTLPSHRKAMIMAKKLFSPTEVAQKLRVSTETIRRLCREGHIKSLRIGRQYRIVEEDLMAYLNRNKKK